jgi:hypothetical protein
MNNFPPTPKHNHPPIKMRKVADDFEALTQVGDFAINEEGTQILLALPSQQPFTESEKKGKFCYVSLPIGTVKPPSSPSWQWDGNRESPTLSPSVWTHGHWHGFIRNGEMIEA